MNGRSVAVTTQPNFVMTTPLWSWLRKGELILRKLLIRARAGLVTKFGQYAGNLARQKAPGS
jgi:hypothetical protein